MFLNLVASTAETVNGYYPGGASAGDPVPDDIAYYLPDWGYGVFAFAVLALMAYMVTRLNVDR